MTHLKLHYKSLILILLLSFIPAVSAETTFFDDPNLAFIIGEFAEEEEAVSQPQASTGGGGDISAEVPVIQLPTYASTIELSLGFISALEKIVSNFLATPKSQIPSDQIYTRYVTDTNYIAVIISLLFVVTILILNQKHPHSRRKKHTQI